MQLLISNEQKEIRMGDKIKGLLKRALEEVLREEGFSPEFIEAAEVSMVLVDDARMAELNEKYRGITGTTDVLSFPMLEGDEGPEAGDPCDEFLLGDIVISVPRAREQARACGHSLEEEMAFLAVHSMLHLLGYDHERSDQEEVLMREKEKIVMARLEAGGAGVQ